LPSIQDKIFAVDNAGFESLALEVFQMQYQNVAIYRSFCDSLRRSPEQVKNLTDVPFLPVEFFKSYKVLPVGKEATAIFESSGTTGTSPSRHYVLDTALYERSFLLAFEQFYGKPDNYTILALLPSYLERGNSSLVYMADKLIRLSGKIESGFFLNEFENLAGILNQLKAQKKKTILLGVTYGLLDFAEAYTINFPDLIIMETGGMKGRREELTRVEVHQKLQQAFGVENVHSEYGMTELLSQGYSKGKGVFLTPAWMKIVVRDVYDPLLLVENGRAGGINIIDLANLNSCSFISTSDLVGLTAMVALKL
jgi:phenylacetate-coenzyme A ligase PaaK-like adenylate-forming protein